MSNKQLNLAWDLSLKPGAKLVLICLADMSNDSGFCFPGQSEIAKRTGLDRTTVNRHIQSLQKQGLLTQQKQMYRDGRYRTSLYQLNLPTDFLPCAEMQHHRVANTHNKIPHRDPSYIGGIH